jgi:hypothetical protein
VSELSRRDPARVERIAATVLGLWASSLIRPRQLGRSRAFSQPSSPASPCQPHRDSDKSEILGGSPLAT